MDTIGMSQAGERALIQVYLANILVHRFFQRRSEINILHVFVHAVVFIDVEFVIHHFLDQFTIRLVSIKMVPAVAVAEPEEVAVSHENHAVSGLHIAAIALLNEGG